LKTKTLTAYADLKWTVSDGQEKIQTPTNKKRNMFSTEKFRYAAQWTVVSLVVGSSSGTPHASHHFLRTADTPSQGLSVPASFALYVLCLREK
jgi:hypothetical protein